MNRLRLLILVMLTVGLYAADELVVPDLGNRIKNNTDFPLKVTIEGTAIDKDQQRSPVKKCLAIEPGESKEYLTPGSYLRFEPNKFPITIEGNDLKISIPESGCYAITLEEDKQADTEKLTYSPLMV